jgi:hypothetical protein
MLWRWRSTWFGHVGRVVLLDLLPIERRKIRKSSGNKDIFRRYPLAIRRSTKKPLDKVVGGVVRPINDAG